MSGKNVRERFHGRDNRRFNTAAAALKGERFGKGGQVDTAGVNLRLLTFDPPSPFL